MPVYFAFTRAFFILVLLITALGCEGQEGAPAGERGAAPELTSRADTLASRLAEAHGRAAFEAAPYLRFEFAVGTDSTRRLRARHLWNRRTGAYRVEMPAGTDSTYVVLLDVGTQEGTAYLNGVAVDSSAGASLVKRGYSRFINDTYWLLAPLKVFDPGVRRAYAADSSGSGTEVLQLSFDQVGLTPGDRYWMYVDGPTGRLGSWAYQLEGWPEGRPPSRYDWVGYETFDLPAGTIMLATRKQALGSPSVIYTDAISFPAEVDDRHFTDPGAGL